MLRLTASKKQTLIGPVIVGCVLGAFVLNSSYSLMKLTSCFAMLLLLAPALASAQKEPVLSAKRPVLSVASGMPAYSGCTPDRYPAEAVAASASGRTIVAFSLDENGYLIDTVILRTAGSSMEHKLLDAAAARSLWTCRFGRPQSPNGLYRMEFVWELPANVHMKALPGS